MLDVGEHIGQSHGNIYTVVDPLLNSKTQEGLQELDATCLFCILKVVELKSFGTYTDNCHTKHISGCT